MRASGRCRYAVSGGGVLKRMIDMKGFIRVTNGTEPVYMAILAIAAFNADGEKGTQIHALTGGAVNVSESVDEIVSKIREAQA